MTLFKISFINQLTTQRYILRYQPHQEVYALAVCCIS